MKKQLKVGIIGCGTIGSYLLDALMEGKVEGCRPVVFLLRTPNSQGREKLESSGIPWVTEVKEMLDHKPDVIIESASHDAIEKYGLTILRSGVDLITLSLGALVDGKLLQSLIDAAEEGGCTLRIPSGGIGALDALQAALIAGLDSVVMTTRKKATTWKGIPRVEEMNIDLDNLKEPYLLFEGPARDCVKDYPQSINIAAALSLAGIGFDRTIIKIYADPHIKQNTHEIKWSGPAGDVTVTFENTPVPSNPKTTYQACLSALAALKRMVLPYHMGT